MKKGDGEIMGDLEPCEERRQRNKERPRTTLRRETEK